MKLRKYGSLILASLMVALSLTACTGSASNVSSEDGLLQAVTPNGEDEEIQRDEEIIDEAEKQEIADGMLGTSGGPVKTYGGRLGYGYNILESDFFNYKDIKSSHPIIDTNTLAAEDLIYIDYNGSKSVIGHTFASNSTKQYSHDIAAVAGVKMDIGFTGSFEASFGIKRSEQLTTNQQLVTTLAVLETQNDYILDCDAKMLAQYATKKFKEDAAQKSAEELINIYGTHVLANISLGGRFDLNYLYTKTSISSSVDIVESAKASYRYVSGTYSGEDSKNKQEVENNSKVRVRSMGGDVTVNITSVEAAVKSYAEWSKSVNKDNAVFVNASEVYPIWEIIANLEIDGAAEKSAAVKAYFDKRVDEISGEFKTSVTEPIYISELHVISASSDNEAKTMLWDKGVSNAHILDIDLNRGAGGKYIYLGYKTTTNKNEAITGIVADFYSKKQSSDITYNKIKYTIISEDLNRGARGNYIYLYYTKDPAAGKPLTEIKYQVNNTFQYGDATGYSAVRSITEDKALDLNRKAGGDFIYLWYKR